MSKSKRSLKITLKGIDWTIYGQNNAAYIRSHGKDSGAITYTGDKDIYFNLSHFSSEYVRHEIMHAMVASSGTTSSSLSADQMEELICELYGEHGPELDMYVDKIVNFLLK